ncbi:hypothetical protein WT15_27280 [Burkholderia stagnalis]|uniref:hypothetical protein n=1 Tax=Burkholderia stagnalis TaxID=1503054 RepID=UPI00075EC97D|nr:hypothetical protein [Burkholderia stagnalis]KVN72782.1 hypothetical protein WT15_27280 [Burkholderia stagnalis]KWO38162.1 hypothetical protein WT96_12645 [Burkholderia stagnalis]KWO44451.1 hypothetical protein WT95_29510 [Burkholderia stagnalis]
MKTSNDLYRLVAAIRHDTSISVTDRELFRPLFAAFDGGSICAVPEHVERRVRHYAGRMPAAQK